jgi:enoyl-CoA hydratase
MSGASSGTIAVSVPAPGVRLVRLDRPEARNALSRALLCELAAALAEASADDGVRCVVLTGDERAFSAGADIKEMNDGGVPMWGRADRLRAWKTIETFPKPLVAAVNGYALGGGCELTMLCDIVILGDGAKLGFPEVKIAAFAGDGGTQRAPRLIGKTRAMWMMMTGEHIDARTAAAWGFGVEVVPAAETVSRAVETASRIAQMSPIALAMIKKEVLMSFEKPLDESLSLERKLLLWQTADHDEGVAAFKQKRQPRYTGR